MAELLYLKDCYRKEFEAQVIGIGDGTEIVLDKTLFYPNSGGQPNDTGILRHEKTEYKVVDVLKKDGIIIHKVNSAGLKPDDKVTGIIDWDRRYRLMRYHTAAHMLSTLIHNDTGAAITGNQLYLDKARVDFSLERFDRELMKSYEEKANSIIIKNLPVSFRILDREDAFKIPALVKLRKQLPESITEIRIVDIASKDYDFDHQACGGTHLSNTSEIKRIEIFALENKGKDRKRIYFRLMD
jgi:misacylated tRNA(Ala) deacylase